MKDKENNLKKISMYETSRLHYSCKNIISMIEIIENGFEQERLPLIRKVLAEYLSELFQRYNELIKEFDKIQ